MQQDIIINNYVLAEFYICAQELDFEKINSLLNISKYKIKTKDSFLLKDFSKDYWSFDTGYEESEDINIQLNTIYDEIRHKYIEINKLKKLFDAETGFVITIKQEKEGLLPAVYFEKEFIQFAASIGADINMDFI